MNADPGKHVFKMTAKSDLKKYEKLNGYSAESWSTTSFIKHLSKKFPFSEFELRQAVYKNKIVIHI